MNSAKKQQHDYVLISSSGEACLLNVSSRGVAFRQVEGRFVKWRGVSPQRFVERSSVSTSGGACLLSVSSRGVAFRQVEGRVSSTFRREE